MIKRSDYLSSTNLPLLCRSTGDLRHLAHANSSICNQYNKHYDESALTHRYPPEAQSPCQLSNSVVRKVSTIQPPFSMLKDRRISASLADIENFHHSWRKPDPSQEGTPPFRVLPHDINNRLSFTTSLSSIESDEERPIFVPEGVVVTREHCILPPVWVHPASPIVEPERLQWPLPQHQRVQMTLRVCRETVSSCINKVPDELLHNMSKQKPVTFPRLDSKESLTSPPPLPTVNSFPVISKWPSMRKKKTRSCKSKMASGVPHGASIQRTHSEKYSPGSVPIHRYSSSLNDSDLNSRRGD